MCPFGTGQIHTFVHAGGITSDLQRATSAAPSGAPVSSRYTNPLPRRRRAQPGESGWTRRSLGMRVVRYPRPAAGKPRSGEVLEVAARRRTALALVLGARGAAAVGVLGGGRHLH